MAVVWHSTTGGVEYEVRKAGHSIRLYTDGVFHTQYNAITKSSRGIWDLLVIPASFLAKNELQRVLLLGVGGGAAARLLLDHFDVDNITGIELNPVHIRIAKKFFGLEHKKVTLVEADAVQWLKEYRGEPFDLVIEDLFAESDGDAARVVTMDRKWLGTLQRNLAPHGCLVANFISPSEFRKSVLYKDRKQLRKTHGLGVLTHSVYQNTVCALFRNTRPSPVSAGIELPDFVRKIREQRERIQMTAL